ncbi:MAG TPA: methyltransferase domain-containing protein [Polyangiales bacterium]|jgi:cyclopropane fatty-acyl-phospholipid synthase-like methyltransferase|nr:methyltransferase domain-containing protein [Polyangiales bacterium]
MPKDHFADKASSYEHNQERVDNVAQIARAMLAAVQFQPSMELMDFGSGTGLLLERIAPHVRKITAVDVSPAMHSQLREKLERIACSVEQLELDLAQTELNRKFDGIISSMTLHHVQDVQALFKTFHTLLREDGFIALADLALEDGTFHTHDTGVHHAGFKHDELQRITAEAGFREVSIVTASTLHKHDRDYPVFLLTARRG